MSPFWWGVGVGLFLGAWLGMVILSALVIAGRRG
jgi:hypothetical protein